MSLPDGKVKPELAAPASEAAAQTSAGKQPTGLFARFAPVLLLLFAEGVFIFSTFELAARNSPPGRLVALDALTLPGADVKLGVRLERERVPILGGALGGVEITFDRLPGDGEAGAPAAVGRAVTDEHGEAMLCFKAPAESGAHRFRARLSRPGAYPLDSP